VFLWVPPPGWGEGGKGALMVCRGPQAAAGGRTLGGEFRSMEGGGGGGGLGAEEGWGRGGELGAR